MITRRAAARVAVRALLASATTRVIPGCSRRADPELEAREWKSWQLPAMGASLPTPRSLAVGPNDELAALDTAGRVIIYDSAGHFVRQWQMLDVRVGKPEGIVFLRDGRLVVCDTHYHRVVYFDADGHWLRDFGQHGQGPGEFLYPVGICTDPRENLYICEYGGHDRVQKFTRDGQWLAEFGSFGTGSGQFQRPSGLAWHDGKVFVADAINNRVLIFSEQGSYLGDLGTPQPTALMMPYDIAIGPDGVFNLIEYGAGRLTRVRADGVLAGRLGTNGSGTGEFATPWGVAVDSRGRIFVADTRNRRIVRLHL